MGWYKPDPYGQPSSFGLRIVFDYNAADSYEYDMFVVWEDAKGYLYYAMDTGCSCSSPFEDLQRADLTPASKADIVKAMNRWHGHSAVAMMGLHNVLDDLLVNSQFRRN
jgi:hypothetical protein